MDEDRDLRCAFGFGFVVNRFKHEQPVAVLIGEDVVRGTEVQASEPEPSAIGLVSTHYSFDWLPSVAPVRRRIAKPVRIE